MIIKASSLFSKIRTLILASTLMLGFVVAINVVSPHTALASVPFTRASPDGLPVAGKLDWDKDGVVQCDWKSATVIICDDFVFGFDPVQSITNKYATFKLTPKGRDSGRLGKDSLDAPKLSWYLHLSEKSDIAYISSDAAVKGTNKVEQITSDDQAAKQIELATGTDIDAPNGSDTNDPGTFNKGSEKHLMEGSNVYALCGLYAKDGQTCWNIAASDSSRGYTPTYNRYKIVDPDNIMDKIRSTIYGYIDSREDCGRDAGSLSFILCPILQTSKDAVSSLIGSDGSGKGFIVELLTVSPLANDAGSNIYRVWLTFRNIAIGLYILIFIAIIFGNGLGFDPYTIKRALPRLATASLLTFGSYFILQTLIDLSNLIGIALPALLQSITGTTGISSFNFDFNGVEAGLTIVLAILVAIAALFSLLIGIAGLIARQIVIYGLILLSPLAFAAWVLPNTESLFKKWWSNLIKVLAMFPIITGMLGLALVYQNTVSTGTSLAVQISGILAPMIALIAIPKTFKWGGDLFVAGAGFIAGRASAGVDKFKGTGKALGGGAKNMAQNKIIQSDKKVLGGNSRLGGFLSGAGAGSLVNSRGGRLRRASNISKVQNEIEKAASVRYDQVMSTQDTDEKKATAFKKLVKSAPREEKFAFAAKAAKSGNMDHVGIAAANMSDTEYKQFTARNFSDLDSMPDLRDQKVAAKRGTMVASRGSSSYAADQSSYRTEMHGKIAGKSSASISSAKPDAQKNMFYTETYDPTTGKVKADGAVDHAAITSVDASQLKNLVSDNTLRGSLSKETLQAFADHAHKVDPTTGALRMDAQAQAIRAKIDASGGFI